MRNISWNPVLDKFIEIKEAFLKSFGTEKLWDYDPKEQCCLQYWVDELNNEEYRKLIEPLKLSEKDNKLCIHYKECFEDGFWDRYNGFYRECRGIVLDIRRDRLLLTPFRKFMNLNECEENSLENILKEMKNAKTIEISEKLDGSMISGRYVDFTDAGLSENNITANHILLASSGQINPDNCKQLKEAYRHLTKQQYIAMKHNQDLTFIYELIAPNIDPHIVDYSKKERGLYLIGLRDIKTGKELPYSEVLYIAKGYGIPVTSCVSASLLDFNKLLKTLDNKKASEAEGFVINVDGHRFKLKYNDYCLIHRMVSGFSEKAVLEAIVRGSYDDYYSKMPESYKDVCKEAVDKILLYDKLIREEVENYYRIIKDLSVKDAMLWIDANVEKNIRSLVRNKYLHKEWSPLGIKCNGQIRGGISVADINRYIEQYKAKEKDNDYER